MTETNLKRFTAVLAKGFRNDQKAMVERALEQGVPSLILDAGYMNRSKGFWQIGVNSLNWCCPDKCPPDRFRALGITLKTTSRKGTYILLCGQIPGDAQHPLNKNTDLHKWYESLIKQIKKHTDKPIFFRPHPGYNTGLAGAPQGIHTVFDVSKDLMEQIEGAWITVCYNSGVGNESLMLGVPVMALYQEGYAPTYRELAARDLQDIVNPKVYSINERLEYFNRLAYSQWNSSEFSSKELWKFYHKHLTDWKKQNVSIL